MRLSDRVRSQRIIDNFQRNQAEMDRLSAEISTGKKVVKAADDPAAYSMVAKYRESGFFNEVYIDNVHHAKSEMELYEVRIDQVTSLVKEIKNLTLEAGNSGTFSEFKENYHERLDVIMNSMLNAANSKNNNEYMFSGSNSGTRPFEATYTGNEITGVTYHGDDIPYTVIPDSGGRTEINLSGRAIFSGQAGMGEDIFQEIVDLKNDMQGDTVENYDQHLDTLDNMIKRLVDKRSEVGSNVKHLDMVDQFLGNFQTTLDEKASEIEGVDLAEAVTRLMSFENVYKASLEVAARMNRMSFLDYMR